MIANRTINTENLGSLTKNLCGKFLPVFIKCRFGSSVVLKDTVGLHIVVSHNTNRVKNDE